MATTRRGFLRWAARTLALLLSLPGIARASEQVIAIHRATRNTLRGAIGARLRSLGARPRRAKAWTGRERIVLPTPARAPARTLDEALGDYAPAAGFAAEPMELATLARLLHFTNGVTGRSRGGLGLRAAPSAGALYAGEIYLVADRVEGLAAGLYAYAPLENALVVLRPGTGLVDVVAAATEMPPRARGAAAAVIVSNVFARYRRRYANRGYRYALIDTGHIAENLRLTACSAGLGDWGPLRFHDAALDELIGADGRKEAVCAVHLVGTPSPRPAEAAAAGAMGERQRSGEPLPEAGLDDPERYHAATALVPAAEPPARVPRAGLPSRTDGGPEAGPLPPAPRATLGGDTVESLIGIRRSARAFHPGSMTRDALGAVAAAASGHPALRRAPGVELWIFAHRVEGLPPGLYATGAAGGPLRPVRDGDHSHALARACLGQDMASSAAAGCVMVARLEETARARGDRAYRDLLVESGAMGQRIYLAAESLGLAARNLAAYVDDELDALLGIDGRTRAAVHLTMVGPGN